MEALIPAVAVPVAAEALKTWGAYAICLLLLGGALWLSERRSRLREASCQAELKEANSAITALRAEVATLQEKRLQDAQEMIRVAKAGTETMAARAAADAEFRDRFSRLPIMPPELLQVLQARLLPPGSAS